MLQKTEHFQLLNYLERCGEHIPLAERLLLNQYGALVNGGAYAERRQREILALLRPRY